MLALPVHVSAELAGQLDGSVRAESLGQTIFLVSVKAWEISVLLVRLDEEVLPSVDAGKSPSVEGDGAWVFYM